MAVVRAHFYHYADPVPRLTRRRLRLRGRSMTENTHLIRIWSTRIVVYVLLGAIAFLMLFPFTYMMFTSFKSSGDVFHYPPRLFPYTPVTHLYNGAEVPLYRFTVDGEKRELVLTEDKVTFGYFSTQDQINAGDPRQSKIATSVKLDEAVETGEEVAINDAAGSPVTFPVYEVTYDGKTEKLVLAYRSKLEVFVDPDNPEIVKYAIARTAQPVENIDFQTGNYDTVFGLNLDKALINTILVTIGVTVGQVVTSIFGGYAFARIPFKGRDALFLLYLGSIMIPFMVLVVPMYKLMVAIHWENRLVSLVVPWIFTAYGTFLMRQFFITIPKELEEAALLDGCSRLRILWTLFVPLSTPAVATQIIFTFLYAWNSFLWPLLIIGEGNEANHVLTLSLIRLSNIAADKPNLVMTGAAVAILPPMIVFILAQRYFIEGIATSGLKG
jgi:multiple sugar transport system permease protein